MKFIKCIAYFLIFSSMLSSCNLSSLAPGIIATKVENTIPDGSWKVVAFTVNQSDSLAFIKRLHIQDSWGFATKDSYGDTPFQITSKEDTTYTYSGGWNDTGDGTVFFISSLSAQFKSPLDGLIVNDSTAMKYFAPSSWDVKVINNTNFVISRNVNGDTQVLHFAKN